MRIFDSSMTPANYRVLLVDDDPAMLRILSKWLAKAGYPVRTAADGQEALDAIELECPDFLVTDWEMPRLDGLELCRQAARDAAAALRLHPLSRRCGPARRR